MEQPYLLCSALALNIELLSIIVCAVKNAMMSAHGRSFFLYSNGIVSPTITMFLYEIHVSPYKGWSSCGVVFPVLA
jgi:hypothetical protein